ncbi:hypothetical protein GNF80_14470 [Clostridium perfringens]|nr:hypothetical protein [Clostridium perfringens]
MNRGFLSFSILFFTTITMGIMLYFVKLNFEQNQKFEVNRIEEENKNYLDENSNKNKEYNKIEEKEDNNDKLDENNNYDAKEKDIFDEYEPEIEKKEEAIEEKIGESVKEIEKNKGNKDKDNFNVESSLEEESEQVFRMDKFSIPKKIAKSDKLKLMSIAKNLSISDYGILLEHIKRSDELDAAVDIFRILKDKLEDKEYKEMKDILSPYINIELIEENI